MTLGMVASPPSYLSRHTALSFIAFITYTWLRDTQRIQNDCSLSCLTSLYLYRPLFFKCDLSLRTWACLPGMFNALLAICLDHWCSIQACAANAHRCSEINISTFPIHMILILSLWCWVQRYPNFQCGLQSSIMFSCSPAYSPSSRGVQILGGYSKLIVISWISSSRN